MPEHIESVKKLYQLVQAGTYFYRTTLYKFLVETTEIVITEAWYAQIPATQRPLHPVDCAKPSFNVYAHSGDESKDELAMMAMIQQGISQVNQDIDYMALGGNMSTFDRDCILHYLNAMRAVINYHWDYCR
jgi:hypothetical protein